MPTTIVLRRFPTPSVSAYTFVSAALLAVAIMAATTALIDEQEVLKMEEVTALEEKLASDDIEINSTEAVLDEGGTAENISVVEDLEEDQNINAVSADKESDIDIWSYPNTLPDGEAPTSVLGSVKISVKRKVELEEEEEFIGTEIAQAINDGEYSFSYGVFLFMVRDPLCLVALVNAIYCTLMIVLQIIQKVVFGKLRLIERQHMKDKFWNFVFYKFIFIFGVMNVQSMTEVLVWMSWFTAIAFLLLLTKLCRDRFEFLSFSPNTPMFYHCKVVGLLAFIFLCCIGLCVVCLTDTLNIVSSAEGSSDIHSMAFMLAECLLVLIKCTHVMIRYGVHLYDIRHEDLWEQKATLVYHVDLVMELLSLSFNFFHHIHMLFSGNIWLSMASLVICMQLRNFFSEIQKRLKRHKNYRRVVANMEAQFPEATKEELQAHEDQCAICWEKMESARKLPCGHFFHSPCLRSWLEQDTTCPTCRKQLGIRNQNENERIINDDPAEDNGGGMGQGVAPNPTAGLNAGTQRNFWHFDGSRFASWLPSFSVEVMHSQHGAQAMVTTRTGQNLVPHQPNSSQFDSMVREVREVFPQIPVAVIATDLRQTNSVEVTLENILEGRVTVATNQIISPDVANSQSDFQVAQPERPVLPQGSASHPHLRRRIVYSHSPFSAAHRTHHHSNTATEVPPTLQQHDAMPHFQSTSTAEPEVPGSNPAVTGGRFSKTPDDRENVLKTRRNELLRQARLKYLNQRPEQTDTSRTASGQSVANEQSTENIQPVASGQFAANGQSTAIGQSATDIAPSFPLARFNTNDLSHRNLQDDSAEMTDDSLE